MTFNMIALPLIKKIIYCTQRGTVSNIDYKPNKGNVNSILDSILY